MIELQRRIYQVYLEFKRVCDQHQLRYYAEGGTKIGATYWSGFIPWDDDMDLVMPLPDYERFLNEYSHELNAPFAVFDGAQCPHTDILFMKIHDTTTMCTMDITLPYPESYTGVLVDVNPLIPMPNKSAERELFKAELLSIMHELYEIRLFDAKGDWQSLVSQIKSIIHRYDYENATYVQPLNALKNNQLFLKEDMDNSKLTHFEESTIYNPHHAKSQIATQYKNFRKNLPPAERTGHHSCLDLNHSCAYYAKRFQSEPIILETFRRYNFANHDLREQLKSLEA